MSKLDDICERVFDYFNSQIGELSNSECAYVLEQLVAKFDGLLELANEAANKENQ